MKSLTMKTVTVMRCLPPPRCCQIGRCHLPRLPLLYPALRQAFSESYDQCVERTAKRRDRKLRQADALAEAGRPWRHVSDVTSSVTSSGITSTGMWRHWWCHQWVMSSVNNVISVGIIDVTSSVMPLVTVSVMTLVIMASLVLWRQCVWCDAVGCLMSCERWYMMWCEWWMTDVWWQWCECVTKAAVLNRLLERRSNEARFLFYGRFFSLFTGEWILLIVLPFSPKVWKFFL